MSFNLSSLWLVCPLESQLVCISKASPHIFAQSRRLSHDHHQSCYRLHNHHLPFLPYRQNCNCRRRRHRQHSCTTWMMASCSGGHQRVQGLESSQLIMSQKLLSCSWQKELYLWHHCGRSSFEAMKGVTPFMFTLIPYTITLSLLILFSMEEEFQAR